MEYEYSFNVSDIEEYLNYCKKNKYNLESYIKQIRTIYRNKNKTIARITIEKGKNVVKKLDFKEDKLDNKDLIVRKESKVIKFNSIKNCEDILNFLEYKKDNTLVRDRYTYVLNGVKFEIDHYIQPIDTFVVAIEGDKEQVDKVYSDLSSLNDKYKIN